MYFFFCFQSALTIVKVMRSVEMNEHRAMNRTATFEKPKNVFHFHSTTVIWANDSQQPFDESHISFHASIYITSSKSGKFMFIIILMFLMDFTKNKMIAVSKSPAINNYHVRQNE